MQGEHLCGIALKIYLEMKAMLVREAKMEYRVEKEEQSKIERN